MSDHFVIAGGEELVAESVCRVRCGARYDKAVFPCWWQRTQEDVFGEVGGAAEPALCTESLHADHGHAH